MLSISSVAQSETYRYERDQIRRSPLHAAQKKQQRLTCVKIG